MSNFKVDDWVRSGMDMETYQLTEGNWSEDVILWTPQPGEWCWFWNTDDEYPTFGKFEKLSVNSISNKYIADVLYLYDIPVTDDETEYRYDWEHCEPFVGSLPSFLRT